MPPLDNARHELFAQALAKGKSATEAYELAGYKPDDSHAARLARIGRIANRIDELLNRSAARVEISKSWVLGKLIENANRAMQAEPLRDSKGNETGEFKYDGSVANRALELVGKELGMFVDRKELKVVDEFEAIDDPGELRRRIAALAAEAGERDASATLAGGAGAVRGKPN